MNLKENTLSLMHLMKENMMIIMKDGQEDREMPDNQKEPDRDKRRRTLKFNQLYKDYVLN